MQGLKIHFCIFIALLLIACFETSLSVLYICDIFFLGIHAIIAFIGAVGRGAKDVVEGVMELVDIIIEGIVDLFTIKSEINIKVPEALRAQILEKKKHAVKVGIYDTQDRISSQVSIVSEQGVSDEIYEGQELSLRY